MKKITVECPVCDGKSWNLKNIEGEKEAVRMCCWFCKGKGKLELEVLEDDD